MKHLFSPELPWAAHYEKGTVLAYQGEPATALFILLQGSAAKTVTGGPPASLQPGDLFGAEMLLPGSSYAATLVAMTELTALTLTPEALDELLATRTEAARELLWLLVLQQPPLGAVIPRPTAPTPAPASVSAPEAEAPTPAPAPAPAAPEVMAETVTTERAELFLEGHGIYDLGMDNNSPLLYQKSLTCPMCAHGFKAPAVRTSKLVAERTDSDLRVHYAGIEPLHYEAITCPKCWYSALLDQFEEADRSPSKRFFEEMLQLREGLPLDFAEPPDSVSVFASYYLALRCAPLCFYRHETLLPRLWVKLGRLYEDCGDTALWNLCCERALEAYLYIYGHTDVPPAQLQQICYMLGELNMRLGRTREARRFFFEAKTDPMGTPAVKRMADQRLAVIMEGG